MKKNILILFVLLTGFFFRASGQLVPPPPVNPTVPNIWKALTKIDTLAYYSAATFAIGHKIYVVMGDTTSAYFKAKIVPYTLEFDTVNKAWRRRADFPGKPRIGAASFSIGTKGYIGGGRDFMKPDSFYNNSVFSQGSTILKTPKLYERVDTIFKITNARGDSVLHDFWEFDTTSNVWTRKADIPGSKMGRAYPVGFAVGKKGYIGLGYDNDTITKLNPTGTFGPINGPYLHSITWNTTTSKWDTILIQSKVLTIETVYTDKILYLKDFNEYDTATNTWTPKTSFPGLGRSHAAGFVLTQGIAVGIGRGDSTSAIKNVLFRDFYLFSPASNSWKRLVDFPASGRYGSSSWGLGSFGYIIAGFDGLPQRDFYEYDGRSDTWDRYPNFPDSTRSLGIGGVVGRMGYFGTGAGATKSFKDIWRWTIDTNRLFIGNISLDSAKYTRFDTICAGTTIYINIAKPLAGYIKDTTKFIPELSDTSGSFFYPISFSKILRVDSFSPDSFKIKAVLPDSLLTSLKYKIRVNAINPPQASAQSVRAAADTSHFFIRRLPFITVEPRLDDSVCLTAKTLLSVFVDLDTSLKDTAMYQWRRNGVPIDLSKKYENPLISGDSLPLYTNPSGDTLIKDTLIINFISATDSGFYDVIVSGRCSPADTSVKVRLNTLNIPPPAIVSAPKNDTICEGSTKIFRVIATGSKPILNYRWLKGTGKNIDTVRNTNNITGDLTDSLTIIPAKLSDSGWYRAYVYEDCGSGSYSDSFYLAFHPVTRIIEEPRNVDTLEHVDIFFTLKDSGTNITYQWYKGSTPLVDGTKFSGVNDDTLWIKDLVIGDVGFYQVEVTGDCGPPVRSLLGLLEIDPAPIFLEQPKNASDCEGSTIYFSVKVDGAGIIYEWLKDGITLTNGGKISGVNTHTLVITDIDATDNAVYKCAVSTGPYTKDTSDPATLVVKPIPPKPVVNLFGPNNLQCSVTADKYRWYFNNVLEPTQVTQVIGVNKIGDYRVRVTIDGCISPLSDPVFWVPTVTGIVDANAGNIKLYPNPAATTVEVEIPSTVTTGEIQIYDMLGKVILTTTFEQAGKVMLDISKLSQGVYFVAVNSNDNTFVGKLVKE